MNARTFAQCLLLLATSAGFVACTSEKEQSDTSGLTTRKLWNKRQLIACWDTSNGGGAGKESIMAAISEAVSAAYKVEVTGIGVSLAKDCKDVPNADVTVGWDLSGTLNAGSGMANRIAQFQLPMDPSSRNLFADMSKPGVRLGGRGLDQLTRTYQPSVTIAKGLSQVAVHEFGHIVGLFHEHAHPQSTCKVTPESALSKFRDLGASAEDAFIDNGSAYDPYSIMSYCNMYAVLSDDFKDPQLQRGRVAFGLSAADKNFLKSTYAGLPQDTPTSSSGGATSSGFDKGSTGGSSATGSGSSGSSAPTGDRDKPDESELRKYDRNP